MSLKLTSSDILARPGPGGLYPTPRMQQWWAAKARTAARPRAMQVMVIADKSGKQSVYFARLWALVFGRNPVANGLQIITPEGNPTAEFLVVANG